MTIDIEPVALIDKIVMFSGKNFPKEVVDACRTLPVYKVRELLDNVAKGKQVEAGAILTSSVDIQTLLRTPGKFTDLLRTNLQLYRL